MKTARLSGPCTTLIEQYDCFVSCRFWSAGRRGSGERGVDRWTAAILDDDGTTSDGSGAGQVRDEGTTGGEWRVLPQGLQPSRTQLLLCRVEQVRLSQPLTVCTYFLISKRFRFIFHFKFSLFTRIYDRLIYYKI